MPQSGKIRCGIGGWTFEPWRGVFYPKGLKHADELGYASRHVTTIEINSTYYSTQKPESFAKWAASAPEGFKFAVKASRFCVNRKKLTDAKPSIEMFMGRGWRSWATGWVRSCGSSWPPRSSIPPTSRAS